MHIDRSSPWFPYSKEMTSTSRPRLFCFPYAGGSSLIFRNWVRSLRPHIDVCPVQLPGRGRRLNEPPFTKMPLLLDALMNAMADYLGGPCAFFGHSMGAVIAFELAHRLFDERGVRLDHLFVSGRRAPQVPDPDPPTYRLPDAEFIEELRRLNGTPPQVLEQSEVLELMLPIIRSDFELVQAYEYTAKSPLPCGITAIGGVDDTDVMREDLEAWQEHTTAPLRMRMLPGDHFFLQTREQQVLDIIELTLRRHEHVA